MEDLGVEAVKILASSAISIIFTGIYLQRWQFREAFIDARISDLLTEVDATAELAVQYWIDSSQPASARQTLVDADNAANLISRQIRIATIRSTVADFLDQNSIAELFRHEGSLFRAFTGGDFRSSTRLCDPDRLDRIRAAAAQYIGLVRNARRRRIEEHWLKNLRH